MNEKDIKHIRSLVVAGNSDEIRELLLCPSHIEIVKSVGRSDLTASHLSELLNISIQHASATLNNIYRKGYLKRRSQSARTGGIEHVYSKKD